MEWPILDTAFKTLPQNYENEERFWAREDKRNPDGREDFEVKTMLENSTRAPGRPEKKKFQIKSFQILKLGSHEKTFALSPVLRSNVRNRSSPNNQQRNNPPVPQEILHQ
jgi:hypothetical protein